MLLRRILVVIFLWAIAYLLPFILFESAFYPHRWQFYACTTELNQFDTRRLRGHMDHYDSNSSVPEKRGKPRMECAYPAIVRGYSLEGKKFEENATVLNLSAGGVYMLLNRFINKGQDLSVKIAFPTGSLEWGSSKLATNGVVVRTEALSEEVLGIAIKFQRRRFL